MFPVRCAPTVDGGSRTNPFLPESPKEIINKNSYTPVPMIIGLNPNEGLLFYLCNYIIPSLTNNPTNYNAIYLENLYLYRDSL